jgi:hypothetical protein
LGGRGIPENSWKTSKKPRPGAVHDGRQTRSFARCGGPNIWQAGARLCDGLSNEPVFFFFWGMKSHLTKSLFFALIQLLLPGPAELFAQVNPSAADTSRTWLIVLRDGTQLKGKFLDANSTDIHFSTPSITEITISSDQIISQQVLTETLAQEISSKSAGPHSTRYLFGPSAFMIPKGEGYFQNTWLFLNSVQLGVSPHFSIGGGIEVITSIQVLTRGELGITGFLTPKLGWKVAPSIRLGGGALLVRVNGWEAEGKPGSFGIIYGMVTLGQADRQFTASMGMTGGANSAATHPVITLSGLVRISRSASLVSENWFFAGADPMQLYSYGIRFNSGRLAVDLAFLNNEFLMEDLVIGLPFVGFALRF